MHLLKQKWTTNYENGAKFYEWFAKNKEKKFVHHVITPVRERAGLGSPPTKFTTNRSERTNGVIQDFIKRRFGNHRVNIFSFAVALKDLIEMQQKEVELSVVGKGEYNICLPYRNAKVSPAQWIKMTQKQQQQALQKIHTLRVEETQETRESFLTRAVSHTDPLLQEVLNSGVDWLPRDTVAFKTRKAREIHNAGTVVVIHSSGTTSTVIVPSKSNPHQPHTVNIHPNGKSECDKNCPGYLSDGVCAHVLAACMKTSTLPNFLRWFVATKRKTGGINYSRAIGFGMPKGRGRKGEKPPRKRQKKTQPSVSIQRNQVSSQNDQIFPQLTNQLTPTSISLPGQSNQPTSIANLQAISPSNLPQQNNDQISFSLPFMFTPNLLSQQPRAMPPSAILASAKPPYPSPTPNSFILYSLHFCPPLTSTCFGCGNSLKPSGLICDPPPPADLVIVSFMQRQYMHAGEVHTRPGNVYFHCSTRCVRLKQPVFDPQIHCIVPDVMKEFLSSEHYQHIQKNLGLLFHT